jgi:ABC-type antimicrobial peptide transport system permease subunit
MLPLIEFTIKDLLHDRNRALIQVISIAGVIASYLLLAGFASTLNLILKQADASHNLVIFQAGIYDPTDARMDSQSLPNLQNLAPTEITQVSPMLFRHMLIADQVMQLRAAPLADWESVHGLSLIAGKWPAAENQVAVGEGAAEANGWEVDTPLIIYSTRFEVAGIFQSPGTRFASVWMDLERAQKLFEMGGNFSALYARLDNLADPEAIRVRLQADSSIDGQYVVYLEDSLVRRNTQAFRDIISLIRVISVIALLGVSLGIFSATSLSLVERSRETAILRIIGFSHQILQLVLIFRAMILAGIGFILGLGVASLYLIFLTPSSNHYILGLPFAIQFSPSVLLFGLVIMLLLCLLGAWLPSRRLVLENVANMLRT